ncbi:MAG: hypothetical protein ACJ75J_11780 [Cytophagaceae bacterium]
MTLQDLLLTPFYLIIIFAVLLILRSKLVKDPIIRKYFFPALVSKIFGALCLGFVYQFYYKGGDTLIYFMGAGHLYQAMYEAPWEAIQLFLSSGNEIIPEAYEYTSVIPFYEDPPTYFIVKLAGICSLFGFHTYAVTAVFFALIAFSGGWAMFLTLYRLYPHLHKQFAISIFFIPSIFFWGSGILKDTITLSALGWIFYAFVNIFIRKVTIKRSFIILGLATYVVLSVKIYILLCFIPAICIWLFSIFSKQIKSSATRAFLRPVLFLGSVILGLMAAEQISSENDKYSFDKIIETSQNTSSYLLSISAEVNGSGYDLGPMDGSIKGFLEKAPAAIWVTMFRPYVWEATKLIIQLSAFESLFFLLLTLTTILKVGIFKVFGVIKNNDYLIFSLVFSITFAFAIGVSTSNFGTLVRYKIPFLPFFISSLFLLRSLAPSKKKSRRTVALSALSH